MNWARAQDTRIEQGSIRASSRSLLIMSSQSIHRLLVIVPGTARERLMTEAELATRRRGPIPIRSVVAHRSCGRGHLRLLLMGRAELAHALLLPWLLRKAIPVRIRRGETLLGCALGLCRCLARFPTAFHHRLSRRSLAPGRGRSSSRREVGATFEDGGCVASPFELPQHPTTNPEVTLSNLNGGE